MLVFPLFRGSRDTRRYDGRDYDTVSFDDIRRLCHAPACEAKLNAPAFIASTYCGHLARSHEEQRRHGQFHALIADIDAGSPSLETVDNAVADVIGDVARLIYSSSSATTARTKWRVIVPIDAAIVGAIYSDIQAAFFDALLDRGIVCDYSLARPGQPVFLPNVPPDRRGPNGLPEFYQSLVRDVSVVANIPSAIAERAAASARAAAEMRKLAEAEALRKEAERVKRRMHLDLPSPIEQFNLEHDLTSLLLKYGWLSQGLGRFASPYSQSKGPSVYVYDQRAVSFTASDAGQIGRATANGWTTYDAWDVYVAREYGGNEAVALIEYREISGYDQRALQSIVKNWGLS